MFVTGLIKWEIIFHFFIDGYPQLVTGIRASNNNCSDTVLHVFTDAIAIHSTPSCTCGDHGTENVEVAAYMEALQGINRGSYIWGQYVPLAVP